MVTDLFSRSVPALDMTAIVLLSLAPGVYGIGSSLLGVSFIGDMKAPTGFGSTDGARAFCTILLERGFDAWERESLAGML